MRHVLSLMIVAALLAACGVKKSLVLPENDKTAAKQQEAPKAEQTQPSK